MTLFVNQKIQKQNYSVSQLVQSTKIEKKEKEMKNAKIHIKSKTGMEYSIYDYTENYKYMKYTYLKCDTV
jgi:hypothetical protein